MGGVIADISRGLGPRLRAWRPVVLAALAYLVITAVQLAPLLRHFSSTVPHDPGDPVLNAWILWWNATATPLSATWWNGLGFFPLDSTLAYSEHLLGLAWLTTPLVWMGASPAAAHNAAFVLSFPLSALAAYALAWQLTGRHDAAFLAGLCFGFHPFRAAHVSHVQVLTAFWMPIALVGLHRYWASADWRWLAVFAAGWLLQSLSNTYYLLYFSVLVVAWLLWFGSERGKLGRLAAATVVWALAAACMAPIALVYRATHAAHGLRRSFEEIVGFSADVVSFASPSPLLAVWGWAQFDESPERQLFLGLTAVIVISAAVGLRLRGGGAAAPAGSADRRRGRVSALLGGVGLVLVIAAIGAWLDAAGRSPVAWFAIRRPEKLFTAGLVAMVLALSMRRPCLDAFRRRSAFAFYSAATVGLLACSLGPEARLFGTKVLYRAPYGYLMAFVPGIDGTRVPARFAMVAAVCFAAALALAYVRLAPAAPRRRAALIAATTVGLLSDGAIGRLPLAATPTPAPSLADVGPGVVLELPVGGAFEDAAALYRSSSHRRRLINGYSGYDTRYYAAVKYGLGAEDPDVLGELAVTSPIVILIEQARDRERGWSRFVERQPGVEPLGPNGGFDRFRLSQRPETAVAPAACCPLAIVGMASAVSPARAGAMVDNDVKTGWRSGREQRPGDTMMADLGEPHTLLAIELHQGAWPADVPHALEIAVSINGRDDWNVVWTGSTAPEAIRAARRNERDSVLRFGFAPAAGRWVRLTQTASGATTAWSVAELRVIGRD
jgi:hypothetical protein